MATRVATRPPPSTRRGRSCSFFFGIDVAVSCTVSVKSCSTVFKHCPTVAHGFSPLHRVGPQPGQPTLAPIVGLCALAVTACATQSPQGTQKFSPSAAVPLTQASLVVRHFDSGFDCNEEKDGLKYDHKELISVSLERAQPPEAETSEPPPFAAVLVRTRAPFDNDWKFSLLQYTGTSSTESEASDDTWEWLYDWQSRGQALWDLMPWSAPFRTDNPPAVDCKPSVNKPAKLWQNIGNALWTTLAKLVEKQIGNGNQEPRSNSSPAGGSGSSEPSDGARAMGTALRKLMNASKPDSREITKTATIHIERHVMDKEKPKCTAACAQARRLAEDVHNNMDHMHRQKAHATCLARCNESQDGARCTKIAKKANEKFNNDGDNDDEQVTLACEAVLKENENKACQRIYYELVVKSFVDKTPLLLPLQLTVLAAAYAAKAKELKIHKISECKKLVPRLIRNELIKICKGRAWQPEDPSDSIPKKNDLDKPCNAMFTAAVDACERWD